ncbi:hypothetical protein ACEWY4_006704 [Coilia grayii]|uniref:Reverse transcriptase N-terminal domain-containing protein n=1 Tax=Coilia grayii TaxID=363190 RepID=A0ABD1KED6_9TELE
MTHIMDNIAPLKTKRVTDNQKAPWKLNQVVKLLKRECRKSERMWRKSKLQIHYQIHKEMLGKYNLEISKARKSFFSNIINNINNAHVLFSTVQKLTNPSSQLPPELSSVNKCNDFASFFKVKIDKIRLNITSQLQIAQNLEPLAVERGDLNVMATFDLVDYETLEKTVQNFISSRVDYCNGLFTGLPKKTIKQLQLIQNAAARVLTRTKRSDHITPVLRSLHWLLVSYRIDFKALLLVFKSLNRTGPNYLLDMFHLYTTTRSLRSLHKNLLVEPAVRTKCGEAAFSCYAVKLWNRLPEDIKNAPTVGSFKSRLKTKLFSDAFCY